MDPKPQQPDPEFVDPERMRRQAEDRIHWVGEDEGPYEIEVPVVDWVTEDGVPVGSINVFHEVRDGEVLTHNRAQQGFQYHGKLYADRKKALEAALSFWQAKRQDALVKIRAISKELGLTG